VITPITRLIRRLRAYLGDVERSRADLADSVSEETALPPTPPDDRKRPTDNPNNSGSPHASSRPTLSSHDAPPAKAAVP
jgi:hypothetical protein